MQALAFQDVSFSYGDDSFQIEHLNFSVEEGEFVAVLGHNGSGKSTLARLADGLLEADGFWFSARRLSGKKFTRSAGRWAWCSRTPIIRRSLPL